MADTNSPASSQSTSGLALALRVFWMMVGNGALAVCTLFILQNRESHFTVADIVYWATLPLMIGARYVDVNIYKGATAYGEPATMAHWRRYSLSLAGGAIAVWLVAHGIAYVLT